MVRQNPISIIFCLLLLSGSGGAQNALYRNEFPLGDVTLLDGPFKRARDLNIKVLLQYDVDRLFATFRKEAGLSKKAELYPNWEGLDGHVAGHYLSAIAMNYVSVKNEECRKRMEYIISELRECQEANGKKYPDWGKGMSAEYRIAMLSGAPLKMEISRHTGRHGCHGITYIKYMPV